MDTSLEVECPRCHAPVGRGCVGHENSPRVHTERHEMAMSVSGVEVNAQSEFCIEGCGRLKQRGPRCETCHHDHLLLAGESSEVVQALAGDEPVTKFLREHPLPGMSANAREVAEAMASYLNSQTCMLLFSKLTLYRACGENPQVRVTFATNRFRVSLVRSNGDVEHFNRDSKE